MTIFANRTVRIGIVALLLAGTAGVGVSLAQGANWGRHGGDRDRGAMIERMIGHMDANADGAVSRAEADAYRTGRIAAADADGDGAITEVELVAHAQARAAERAAERATKMFARMDGDGDGRVLAADFAGQGERRLDRMFDRLDRNGDGMITADEARRSHGRHFGRWH